MEDTSLANSEQLPPNHARGPVFALALYRGSNAVRSRSFSAGPTPSKQILAPFGPSGRIGESSQIRSSTLLIHAIIGEVPHCVNAMYSSFSEAGAGDGYAQEIVAAWQRVAGRQDV
jgi:hypothetical protein